MSTSSRGNAAELLCIKQLQADGWVCGSRRHIGGAGDVLAVRWDRSRQIHEVNLIEVKQGKSAWKNFTRLDREMLRRAALENAAEAFLYFYPTGSDKPEVYHWTEWPGNPPTSLALAA